jgi:hypothetical protein
MPPPRRQWAEAEPCTGSTNSDTKSERALATWRLPSRRAVTDRLRIQNSLAGAQRVVIHVLELLLSGTILFQDKNPAV